MFLQTCIDESCSPDEDEPEVVYTYKGRKLMYVPSDISDCKLSGNSFLREHLAELIESKTLTRPPRNRNRK